MKLLFCNIGWMKNYQGLSNEDSIKNGGSYVSENKSGFESCNFLECDGNVYGYVRVQNELNIDRIGAGKNNNRVDNILVIWTAKNPEIGTVIVGWYKNATVYRRNQIQPPNIYLSKQHENESINKHIIRAKFDDAVLLPIEDRKFQVPRGKGMMGQSPVWYADTPEAINFVKNALSYIYEYMKEFDAKDRKMRGDPETLLERVEKLIKEIKDDGLPSAEGVSFNPETGKYEYIDWDND